MLPLTPRRNSIVVSTKFQQRYAAFTTPKMAQLSDYGLTRLPMCLLSLRPGGSLTLPSRALSISFSMLVALHTVIQVTGPWFLPGQVLSPAEIPSLRWTHLGVTSNAISTSTFPSPSADSLSIKENGCLSAFISIIWR